MRHRSKGERKKVVIGGIALVAALLAVKRFAEIGPDVAMGATISEAITVPSPVVDGIVPEFSNQLLKRLADRIHPIESDKLQSISGPRLKCDPFHLPCSNPSLYLPQPADEISDTFAAAESLNLKAILHGGTGDICLINNAILREHQAISGFVVDHIAETSVIVHRGEYRFELRKNHASH